MRRCMYGSIGHKEIAKKSSTSQTQATKRDKRQLVLTILI